MRRTILIIAACAVAVVLVSTVCIIFWDREPAAGPIKITAIFSGFTNDTTGARLASFRVSNQGDVRVYRWPSYSIEERGHNGPLYRAAFASGASLAPAQSSTYLFPAPTNAAAWRVVFNFSRESWRRRLAGLPPVFRMLVPSKALAFSVEEGISDWVGLEPSSPPPGQRFRTASIVVRRPTMLQPKTNATPNGVPPKK
jgi:hypothetical protein